MLAVVYATTDPLFDMIHGYPGTVRVREQPGGIELGRERRKKGGKAGKGATAEGGESGERGTVEKKMREREGEKEDERVETRKKQLKRGRKKKSAPAFFRKL